MHLHSLLNHLLLIVLVIAGIGIWKPAAGVRKYADEELNNWDPPEELKRKFPCYLSGFDHDGLPVYILELGKWKVRNVLEKGGAAAEKELDKYAEYIGYKWVTTAREFKNDTGGTYGLVVDMEEYDIREFGHLPTVTFVMRSFAARFTTDFSQDLEWIFGINANYFALRLTDLIRPILGSIFSKIEVHGSNKEKWIPQLLRRVPRDSLPHWYGGNMDFKPIAVYG